MLALSREFGFAVQPDQDDAKYLTVVLALR